MGLDAKYNFFRNKLDLIAKEKNQFDSPKMKDIISKRKKWDNSGVYDFWYSIRNKFNDPKVAKNTLEKENLEHDYETDANFGHVPFKYSSSNNTLELQLKEIDKFVKDYSTFWVPYIEQVKKIINEYNELFEKEGEERLTLKKVISDEGSNYESWMVNRRYDINIQKLGEINSSKKTDGYKKNKLSVMKLEEDVKREEENREYFKKDGKLNDFIDDYNKYYKIENINIDDVIVLSNNYLAKAKKILQIGCKVGEINDFAQEIIKDKEQELQKEDKLNTYRNHELFLERYKREYKKLEKMPDSESLFKFLDLNEDKKDLSLKLLFNRNKYSAERTYRVILLSYYNHLFPEQTIVDNEEMQMSEDDLRKDREKIFAKIKRALKTYKDLSTNEKLSEKFTQLDLSDSQIRELFNKYKTEEKILQHLELKGLIKTYNENLVEGKPRIDEKEKINEFRKIGLNVDDLISYLIEVNKNTHLTVLDAALNKYNKATGENKTLKDIQDIDGNDNNYDYYSFMMIEPLRRKYKTVFNIDKNILTFLSLFKFDVDRTAKIIDQLITVKEYSKEFPKKISS